MVELYLIRHGESVANLEHRVAGHIDPKLTELGILQAKITRDALRDVEFDAVFSSDLSRAYDTALPHAELRGLRVEMRDGLREVFLGEWEGLTVDEVVEKYGAESYYEGWRNRFGVYVVPGGEGAAACGRRMYNEIEEICKNYGYGRVLIVSHGAAIRSFYSLALGLRPDEFAEGLNYPSNASISRVDYDGEHFIPVKYSEDSHMESVGITKVNW